MAEGFLHPFLSSFFTYVKTKLQRNYNVDIFAGKINTQYIWLSITILCNTGVCI